MSMIKNLNFDQHPLINKDEHTKNMYFKLLLSTANIDGNNELHDKMVKLIEIIIEEMDISLQINNISKSSILINEDDLKEFIYTICSSKLEQNFIVDALMFSIILDGSSDKVLEYIINLSEILELSQEQLKQLIKLSKIILEQDKIKFKNMCYEVLDINISNFMMYTKSFVDLYVINDFDKYEEIKYDYEDIVFANINLDGEPIENTITDIKNLYFINCKFSNSTTEYTIFDCDKVTIKNCTFDGFNDTVLRIYDCEQVKIISSEFYNCIQNVEEGYVYNSATLLLEDINNVRVNQCKFENCHAIPEQSLDILGFNEVLPGSSAIARVDGVDYFKIEACTFKNCITNKNVRGTGYLFIFDNTECKRATGCKRENCCEIGDERLGRW